MAPGSLPAGGSLFALACRPPQCWLSTEGRERCRWNPMMRCRVSHSFSISESTGQKESATCQWRWHEWTRMRTFQRHLLKKVASLTWVYKFFSDFLFHLFLCSLHWHVVVINHSSSSEHHSAPDNDSQVSKQPLRQVWGMRRTWACASVYLENQQTPASLISLNTGKLKQASLKHTHTHRFKQRQSFRRVIVSLSCSLTQEEEEDKSSGCLLHPNPVIKKINPRWEIYKACPPPPPPCESQWRRKRCVDGWSSP